MVTQARAHATREAIIRGAAVVFERNGYGMASISDIASAASVTKGALYFHFPSKDDLARAVIARQHELSFAAGALVLEQGRPALESMVLMSASLGRQLLTEPVVQAGIRLTTEVSNFERPVADPYDDWLNAMEDLARRAVAEGDIAATVDPEMLAHFIVPAYTGIQLVSATLAGRADLLQRIRELWVLLLPGIVPAERYAALAGLPDLIPTAA